MANGDDSSPDDDTPPDDTSRLLSRRRLVGALGAGLATGALVGDDTASAATGTMQYGAANDSGDLGTSLKSTGGFTLHVVNDEGGEALTLHSRHPTAWAATVANMWSTVGGGLAVSAGSRGILVNVPSQESSAYGLRSRSDGAATAVDGDSEFGVGVRARSGVGRPLVIVPGTVSNPPTGPAEVGTLVLDTNGRLFLCIEGGAAPVWRTVVEPTSGAFHPINPVRPYDSRDTNARLSTGQSRLVDVGTGRDEFGTYTNLLIPYGATAVAFNLTVTQTLGAGHLSICAGDRTTATSIINWTAGNVTVANASVVPIDGSRQVRVSCGGTGSTHFILDISGYYL